MKINIKVYKYHYIPVEIKRKDFFLIICLEINIPMKLSQKVFMIIHL